VGYNVFGWRTDAPNQVGYCVGYQFWTPVQAMDAEFAQAKPEGAVVDGTQNWSLTSYNHNIYLDVASQSRGQLSSPLMDGRQRSARIGYSYLAGSTSGQDLSFMLCGEGLG
jgi:hypothetical protein